MEDASTSRDVFISYASPDKDMAESACMALEHAGVRCWIAPRDVSPGEFYADAIVRGLNEARILVLLLTDKAIASTHVLREVERASAKEHAILALRFSSAALTPALEYFLSASHWLDAGESQVESAMPKLVEAVQRLLAPAGSTHASGPTSIKGPPSRLRSRWSRRIIIAAVALTAVAAAFLLVDRDFHMGRVESPAAAPPSASAALAPAATTPAGNSVAVLPFADMSEKKDQEYFSDGLSEELIDRLAKIPDLAVPGRTSSFYFKGKQATIAEIAKMLGVSHLLEGSVRRSGDRLRVTVQLIRADNGYHLWSETYDRKLSDIFAIQDDISALVTKALKVALLPSAAATVNPNVNANELYLRAKFENRGFAAGSNGRAIELLKQALSLDPKYARAWAMLARLRSHQAWQPELSSLTAAPDAIREARDAAERAVSLAPNIADGHLALGRIYLIEDKDIARARQEIVHAVELEPRNADAFLQLGIIADEEGRYDEAVRYARQALALDPLDPNIIIVLGDECLALGDASCAEGTARKVEELYPSNEFWQSQLVRALVLQGRMQEAYDFAESRVRDEYDHLWNQAFFLPALGRAVEADAALLRLQSADSNKIWPLSLAQIYAHRDDRDRAFEWLDRQYKLDPRPLGYLKTDTFFISLRGDKRFEALWRKVNAASSSVPASTAH